MHLGHAPVLLLAYFNGKWKESVTFLFDHAVALARTFFDAGPVVDMDKAGEDVRRQIERALQPQ